MVGVFRRSLSFQMINQSRPSKRPTISHHTRSISLPACRSHPLIPQLRDQIAELRTWALDHVSSRGSAWLVNGLTRLKSLYDSLDDALHLPQAQDSLRRQKSHVLENLLEDFLRFVDAFGIFQTSIMALREEHSSAEVAMRKRDEAKAILYVKARRRAAKEMQKLASVVGCVSVTEDGSTGLQDAIYGGDAEITSVVSDAISVTVAVSLALFNGMAGSLAGRSKRSRWVRFGFGKERSGKVEERLIGELEGVDSKECAGLRKKSEEERREVGRKMREMEACLGGIESHGQRVFRGLISARVSLLNALTEQ